MTISAEPESFDHGHIGLAGGLHHPHALARDKGRAGLLNHHDTVTVFFLNFDLDAINLVRKVGGTDQMEAIRAAIGL